MDNLPREQVTQRSSRATVVKGMGDISSPFFIHWDSETKDENVTVHINNAGVDPIESTSPVGTVVAAIGDSITAGNGDMLATSPGSSWAGLVVPLSEGRIRMDVRAATSGDRTDQALARIGDVINASPPVSACFVLVGTNDVGQAVPDATIKTNLSIIYDTLQGANILPIALTLPPKNAQASVVPRINSWIIQEAVRRGIPYVDIYTPLVNPKTGQYKDGYSDDGTHPTPVGANVAAKAIVGQIGHLFPVTGPWLPASASGPNNLLANGTFQGDANADGLADSWAWNSVVGTVTASLEPGGDTPGNWQVVTVTASGLRELRHASVSSGFAAGDVIEFSGRIRTENQAGGMKFTVRLQYNDGLTKTLRAALYQSTTDITNGLFVVRAVVPPSTVLIIPSFVTSDGTGTYRLSQIGLRNLTALGLV